MVKIFLITLLTFINKFLRRFRLKSEKKLFIFFGIINLLITTLVLQISLFLMPTLFATLLSQLVNLIVGYFLYGKKVFNVKKLNNLIFKRYFLLSTFIWVLNYLLIKSISNLGLNKNLIAFLILPLIVSISYFYQKFYVFKKVSIK